MSVFTTVLEILVAVLAATGFYALLRGLTASFLSPRQVTVAVVLRQAVDVETLDILLDEARRSPLRRRGEALTVFVSHVLFDGRMGEGGELFPTYADVMARYGAVWFTADLGGDEP